MNTISYFILVNLCISILYGFYYLFLRRETFHQLNRWVLLLSPVLAFVLPLVRLDFWNWLKKAPKTVSNIDFGSLIYAGQIIEEQSTLKPTTFTTALFIYFLGSVMMAIWFLYKIIKLSAILKKPSTYGAFTFVTKSYFDETTLSNPSIVQHEEVHRKQLHSLDILFFEGIQIILWCNPLIYFFKKSLKTVHEYLADEHASRTLGKRDYATLLLSQQLDIPSEVLISSFFQSLTIKNRIMMLAKTKSRESKLLKYGLLMPVLAVFILFSSSFVKKKIDKMPGVQNMDVQLKEVIEYGENKMLQTKNKLIVPLTPILMDTTKTPFTIEVKKKNDSTGIPENSLFYINGEKTSSNLLRVVSPEDIRDIKIIKGKEAVEKYGEEAKNGVILITLKDYKEKKPINDSQNHETNNNVTENEKVSVKYKFKEAEDDLNEVFSATEQIAEFPGGVSEMYKFFAANISYPESASINKKRGRVYVKFIVDKNGNIRKPEIIRGAGYGMDEEALRLILKSPKWKPALQNGKAVNSYFSLPIKFEL
jgi:TonB family protein